MNRRQYLSLGATGVILGLAGCTGGGDGQQTGGDDSQQFPPYPDSESTEFSGDGQTLTDSFELQYDGPTIIAVDHEGDGNFGVSVVDGDEQPVPEGAIPSVTGPYNGRSIHELPVGSYSLNIQASGEWTATVYDLPVYEDGTGLSLPLDREGAFGEVIGPINFDSAATPSAIEFEISYDDTESINRALLVDREGQLVGALFDNQQADDSANGDTDADETTQTLEVAGVGYLAIESTTGWTLSIA